MRCTLLGYRLFKTCMIIIFCFHGYSARCQKSMNHENDESAEHQSDGRCHYQAQYDNRIFTCRVSCRGSFFFFTKIFLGATEETNGGKFLPMRSETTVDLCIEDVDGMLESHYQLYLPQFFSYQFNISAHF